MSKLFLLIKGSNNGTLAKWTIKFQCKDLVLDDSFGPWLASISSDNKSRFLKLFMKYTYDHAKLISLSLYF